MKNNDRFKKTCTLAASIASATLMMSQPAVVSAAESFSLEEVVVTARKRQESLLEAPVAITAVSGDDIEKQGITSMEQLSAKVPGLQIGRAAQTSNVVIRGIGSGINKGFEQSVGMYVDGIYQSRSRQFTSALVDLQQVEVLRGPQGVLFGKNTVAGAIKVETATPQVGDELSGSLSVAWEPEQDTQRYTGIISGDLSDSVAARLVVRDSSSDGYFDNKFFNRDEQKKDDQFARLSLAWEASDTLSVEGKVSYLKMEGEGKELTINAIDSRLPTPGTVQLSGLLAPGFGASSGFDNYLGNQQSAPGGDVEDTESLSTSIKLEWDLGDYTLTALSGYSDFEFSQFHDVDFLPVNFIQNLDEEELKLYSQEIRLASNWDGAVNFIGGVYYEKQELALDAITFLSGDFGGVTPTSQFGPVSDIGQSTDFDQETKTLAFFGEMTIDFTENLSLNLGLRYSEDEKDITKRVEVGVGRPGSLEILVRPEDTLGSTADNYVANAVAAATAAGNPLGGAAAAVYASALGRYASDIPATRTEYHFDPSATLSWDYSDTGMVYMSFSEGYKSGGFNFSPDSANPDGTPNVSNEFEDESVTAWELGVKQELWDGRARFGAIAFYTDLENLQVTSFSGASFVVGNAAEVTVKGIELDGQLLLTENLEVGGSLSYLDHEFGSYPGAACSTVEKSLATCPNSAGPGTKDLSGKRGAFAPEYSAALYLDYTFSFDQFEVNAHIDVNYKDEMFLADDLDENAHQDSFVKVDARLGLSTIDGKWDFLLYGRNLTEEVTYTASVDAPLTPGAYAAWVEEPRIVGIQGRYNF